MDGGAFCGLNRVLFMQWALTCRNLRFPSSGVSPMVLHDVPIRVPPIALVAYVWGAYVTQHVKI